MSMQVSQTIMAICLMVITLGMLTFWAVVILTLLKVRKSIDKVTNRAQPLISQATETMKTVNGAAQSVKSHIDGIMDRAEDTVDNVTRKVKTTSSVIQDSIGQPVISMGSLLTGVAKGLEVYGHLRKRGGNGHAKS